MIMPLLALIVRENRLLLALVAAGLITCSISWVGVSRQQNTIMKQQALWNQYRQQSGTAIADSGRQSQDRSERLLASALEIHQLPEFIGELLDLISHHDALAGSITYKPNKSGIDGLVLYQLNCLASGSYADLKRLIADLEQLAGLTVLESIKLARKQGDSQSVTLDLQLTILLREAPRP